jgi:uncharacterized protein (TIGR02271 family)
VEHSSDQVVVIDQDGVRGRIDAKALERRDQRQVIITYNGDRHVQAPVSMLQQQADGVYHLPLRLSTLEANTQLLDGGDATVIPVIQEEVEVDRRPVERGRVRITKNVHTEEETIDAPLRQERVQVERIPIEEVVETPVATRYEGDTLVIPVMEEVLVIEKKLFLKEEVRITKYVGEVQHQETVTLNREEVSVQRTEV